MKAVAAVTMLLALAACSKQASNVVAVPSQTPTSTPSARVASKAKVDEKQAAAAIDKVAAKDPAGAAKRGLPVAAPTPRRLAETRLPTAFQGHWGLTPGECDMSRVDAKGRLGIEGNKLVFYEATGTVSSLAKLSDTDVTATIDYSGEGQKWSTHTRFALVTGGTGLLRSEQSPVKTYRYSRC